jgi:hypothetical protein
MPACPASSEEVLWAASGDNVCATTAVDRLKMMAIHPLIEPLSTVLVTEIILVPDT